MSELNHNIRCMGLITTIDMNILGLIYWLFEHPSASMNGVSGCRENEACRLKLSRFFDMQVRKKLQNILKGCKYFRSEIPRQKMWVIIYCMVWKYKKQPSSFLRLKPRSVSNSLMKPWSPGPSPEFPLLLQYVPTAAWVLFVTIYGWSCLSHTLQAADLPYSTL